MSWQRNRDRARAFIPRVEALEDRTVPAAFRIGSQLFVTGNFIVIGDSGDSSASNSSAITVFTDGLSQSFAGDVSAIFITGNAGPSGDHVFYLLGGANEAPVGGSTNLLATRASRAVITHLASTTRDSFLLNLQATQWFVGANYLFDLYGGNKGNDFFVHSDNVKLDNASTLKLNLFGGTGGKDNIAVNMNNLQVAPDTSPGFAGEASSGTAVGAGTAQFLVNVNAGPFAPPTIGAGDKIYVYLGFNQISQGQIAADVKGGSRSLPPSTPGGSSNGSNLVELVVNLPPLTSAQAASESSVNSSFTQSKAFLVVDGGGKGPNTVVHNTASATLLEIVLNNQIDLPVF
jgi:hypothetical protein